LAHNGINHPTMGPISDLGGGKLFALHDVLKLDGRIASFPLSARGWAPSNCYLIRENDGALLLDTGYGSSRDSIIAQIESLIGRDTPLAICPLRLNDYMSVCNVRPITMHFSNVSCFALNKGTGLALDFQSQTEEESEAFLNKLTLDLKTGNEWVKVGANRDIKLNQSPIRLIATRWVYDPVTKTLMSSDMFAHSWGSRPDESWFIDEHNDTTTEEDIRAFLLSTRYWWLEGSKTDSLRRGMTKIFEEFDIEMIAPGYGKLLRGRKTVQRHYQMLDNVLRDLDISRTPARYVARNEEHYA
jgi:flavorubredoxin